MSLKMLKTNKWLPGRSHSSLLISPPVYITTANLFNNVKPVISATCTSSDTLLVCCGYCSKVIWKHQPHIIICKVSKVKTTTIVLGKTLMFSQSGLNVHLDLLPPHTHRYYNIMGSHYLLHCIQSQRSVLPVCRDKSDL